MRNKWSSNSIKRCQQFTMKRLVKRTINSRRKKYRQNLVRLTRLECTLRFYVSICRNFDDIHLSSCPYSNLCIRTNKYEKTIHSIQLIVNIFDIKIKHLPNTMTTNFYYKCLLIYRSLFNHIVDWKMEIIVCIFLSNLYFAGVTTMKLTSRT